MDLYGTRAICSGKYDLGGMWGSGDVVASVGSGPDEEGPALRLRVDIASGPLKTMMAVAGGGGGGNGNDGRRRDGNDDDDDDDNGTTTPPPPPPARDDDDDDPRASLPFPTTASLSRCEPNFLVGDLTFSGSISSHLVGLFSGTISGMITNAANEHACSSIKTGGESYLDAGLSAARDYVGGLILNNNDTDVADVADVATPPSALLRSAAVVGPRSSPLPPTSAAGGDGGGVGWDANAPFLKRVLVDANDFVSRHLDEGIVLGSLLRKLGTWGEDGSSPHDDDDGGCEDCGGFFRGLNGLVRSLAGGGGGKAATLDVPVPETFLNFRNNVTIEIPRYGDVVLTARNLKVSGIDNFTELSLLYPSGKNTLSSSMKSDVGFNFTVLFDLEVRPASNGSSAFEGDTLNETFELRFDTSYVNFESLSSWELDPDVFGKLTVGSFLYGSYTTFDSNRNMLSCVFESLRSASILDLRARLAIDAVRVTPFPPSSFYEISLEDNIDDLMNVVIQLLLSEYPETSTEAFSGLVQIPLRSIINDKLDTLIGDTKMMPLHCVNVDNPTNKPVRPLRFDSNRAIVILNDIINAEGTIGVVNEFIKCVNNFVETRRLVAGHFFNFSFGQLGIVLHDLRVENLDSVYELKLLEPDIDHYHLENSLGYGSCVSAEDRPCNTTASFSFGMNLVHSSLGDMGNINVRMNMRNLKLQGGTELLYDMNYFPQISISDLLAHPQCMSVPVTDFDFYGFNATVDMLEVEVDVSLSGEHVSPHSYTYKTVDPSALASAISALTANGANLLQEALGDTFLQFINEASVVCDTPANPRRSIDMAHSTGNAGLWTFLIILAFITFNAWLFLRGVKNDDQEGIVVNSEDEGVVANSEGGEAQSDEQLG